MERATISSLRCGALTQIEWARLPKKSQYSRVYDGWLLVMSKVSQRLLLLSYGRMRNSFCESYAGSSYSKRVVCVIRYSIRGTQPSVIYSLNSISEMVEHSSSTLSRNSCKPSVMACDALHPRSNA